MGEVGGDSKWVQLLGVGEGCKYSSVGPKQHSQMGPSRAHPGPIWGPTLPNWGPTRAHMECCLGRLWVQLVGVGGCG